MRAFTSLASPASVSRRHSPALIPREFALALRGRRHAGARFSALLRAAGLAVAIWWCKREHEHTHVGTQTLHGRQVRDHRAAHPSRTAIPRKPAARSTAQDLPGHTPSRLTEEKS